MINKFQARNPISFQHVFLVSIFKYTPTIHDSNVSAHLRSCAKLGTSIVSVLIMVNIVGYTIDHIVNTRNVEYNVLDAHYIYQPTLIDIKGSQNII